MNWCSSHAQDRYALYEKADSHFVATEYVQAQKTYFNVLNLSEKAKDINLIIKTKRKIAFCHYYMRDKPVALSWLHQALALINEHKKDSLRSDTYYTIGVMHIELGHVDSAEYYAKQAIDLFIKNKDYTKVSQTYSALSDIYLNTTKDFEKAKATILKAEKYANLSDQDYVKAFVNMKWYFLYATLKKDYKTALTYVNKAEKLYLKDDNREGIMYAYNQKAYCLAYLGDTSSAAYMNKWFAFKDSIFNIEKANGMAMYEKQYEIHKKEIENKLLRKENESNHFQLKARNYAIVLFVILILLIVSIGFRIINHQKLKRQHQEIDYLNQIQQDKERIARDLHDNVGGQLSYINYCLDGLDEEPKEKQQEIVSNLTQSVKNVIGSIRETIWAISGVNMSIVDFSDKLKVYTKKLFQHTSTKVVFNESIQSKRELNALQGLNLYRICQEILANTLKHAKATTIELTFEEQDGKIKIVISDNGVGFDTKCQECGLGLQNIKERASEFDIKYRVDSQQNKGTTYTLFV
ncbi:MAG: histidine kinase [Crocinitomicaceae bacterium]|nr:histidine kinase [Crocinitomicaceae bacterium]